MATQVARLGPSRRWTLLCPDHRPSHKFSGDGSGGEISIDRKIPIAIPIQGMHNKQALIKILCKLLCEAQYINSPLSPPRPFPRYSCGSS